MSGSRPAWPSPAEERRSPEDAWITWRQLGCCRNIWSRGGLLKRYDRTKQQDREELDARLDALATPRSNRRRKPRSNAGPTVLGFLLVVGILAAIYLIYTLAGSEQEEPQGPAKIEVVKGDTLSIVAEKLERAGVIDSAFMFKVEARMEGYGTEIKTGEYTFARGEDTRKILEKLTAGEAIPTLAVTIPEGLTLEQTSQEVARQSGIPAAKFEEAARRTDYGYGFLENSEIETTEGFLFPKQ